MGKEEKKIKGKAWVVAVNMGYGHQRTAFPLRHLAPDHKVINANDYAGIPFSDRRLWESTRMFYEFISNFKRIPIVGGIVFKIFDKFQRILSFYPKRDLSKSNASTRYIFSLIRGGWGKHLVEKISQSENHSLSGLKEKSIPLVTTFFTSAFMAENYDYPGEIYCVICDADLARSWVSLNPGESRIRYFAPNHRVVDRLKLYGVPAQNIFLTGYPLPVENIGSPKMEILKYDVSQRILNLDPLGIYRAQYAPLTEKYLGHLPSKSNHQLTIMFSIGGAGAQTEIVIKIVKSLGKKIKNGEIKAVLMAGVKEEIKKYFLESLKISGLSDCLRRNIEIVCAENMEDYFKKFNENLRVTDILWTKPSELSFYSGLGVPIIIAPTIGSQEEYNQEWLLRHGTGVLEKNPDYADEWLFEFIRSGLLANAAMKGFIEVEKMGVFNIEKIISRGQAG